MKIHPHEIGPKPPAAGLLHYCGAIVMRCDRDEGFPQALAALGGSSAH